METYLDNSDKIQTMNDVEDATETVVAQLVYDEGKDELKSDLDELDDDEINDNFDGKKNKLKRINPVFAALDDAKDVDDMFRIAEIWVNPISYGIC